MRFVLRRTIPKTSPPPLLVPPLPTPSRSKRLRFWQVISDQPRNTVIQTLGALVSTGAIVYGVVTYFADLSQTQAQARLQAHLIAWQIIDVARGQPASGGRIEAMQSLSHDRVSMEGLGAPNAHLEFIQLPGADLDGAQLNGASLDNANLEAASLIGANLENAYLNNTVLPHSNLTGVHLRRAQMNFADLHGANLEISDLRGTELDFADLTNTILLKADLTGADLTGANLRGAMGTTLQQLAKASSLFSATMPDGSKHP
jgi:uncharacterized protein YjbI with pentapeptide repeats